MKFPRFLRSLDGVAHGFLGHFALADVLRGVNVHYVVSLVQIHVGSRVDRDLRCFRGGMRVFHFRISLHSSFGGENTYKTAVLSAITWISDRFQRDRSNVCSKKWLATSGSPLGDSFERRPLDNRDKERKRISRHDLKGLQAARLGFELRKEEFVKIVSVSKNKAKGNSVALATKERRELSGPEWTAKCLGDAASM